MTPRSRSNSRAWIVVLACACGFLIWINYRRAQRVESVTNTEREAVADANSSTGYAGGKRWLIVPEHNNRSYQWIAETQQMLAQGEWRVRRIDYENAPLGREVHSASPYRWWLGLIAWCDHVISGRPLGLSVERAALWADPLLHVFLLLGTTIFVARQFGPFPTALLAGGMAVIYPFAGGFLPGAPDDSSLARIFALWSVLPLLAAVRVASDPWRRQRLFFVAGVAGGLGLWVSAASQVPVLAGIALGAILAAWISARGVKENSPDSPEPALWRRWAFGGATTCLAAYLIEYFPAHMDFRLQVNHPLFGLAWIGVGEVLVQMEAWFGRGKFTWTRRQAFLLLFAIAAVAALPVAMKQAGTQSLLVRDLQAARLSYLPDGVVAKSLGAWIARDGLTKAAAATCLPLLFLALAVWLLARRKTDVSLRAGIAFAIGPVLVALVLAFTRLAWWSMFDAVLLVLVIAGSAALQASTTAAHTRWLWSGFAGLVFLPGLVQLAPRGGAGANIEFTRLEVEGLIERTLAHWIADHAGPGGAVILVPPDRTTSWCFHGGMRGLGTANWENRDGLTATVRIVTATTMDEAQALISQRGVTHLALPSWDSDLDEFARWTLRNPNDAFIAALHHWALPPWLRPLPYRLPVVAGFENQSVALFAVTDEGNRAAALSRVAEYFVEMQQVDRAASSVQALQRYPTDLGALVALARVEKARGDAPAFTQVFTALLASLSSGSDRALAWDRRVSLAVVLALGGRNDLAREQARRCFSEIDEGRLRSLTTGSLYSLLVLGKTHDLKIADQRQRELASRLLPAELRRRL
ncbi:MAG TPA: hypothetical protein VHO24_20400 [Opitutaceae bacterium]|nr:hypothetical protein [Opitutaceae bacterium]